MSAQVTEGPLTIALGRVQIRTDVLSAQFGDGQPVPVSTRYPQDGVAVTCFTAGVTQDVDVELGCATYFHDQLKKLGGTDANSGIGDVFLRTKWTFWSDASLQALAAVVPYLTLPTNSAITGSHSPGGGLLVPWSMALDRGYRVGAMAEGSFLRHATGAGYDSRWLASLVLQRDLNPSVGLYAETTLAFTSAGLGRTAFAAGGGVTLDVMRGLELDAALYAGLANAAETWNPVLRLRWQF
jgi:hypothetical protein